MTLTATPPFTLALSLAYIFTITAVNSLGSASTTAITYGTATVCGIVAGQPDQCIQCYRNGTRVPVILPNVSFQAISGGRSFFCGLRSGGYSLHCWDTTAPALVFRPKRLYHSELQLSDVAVGDDQVCARELNSGEVRCWRGGDHGNGFQFPSPGEGLKFRSVTSGCGFSCGILKENNRVWCWGEGGNGNQIHQNFGNFSMSTLVAGVSHVCGLTFNGILVCGGNNGSGQLGVPFASSSDFSGLALGEDFTCAIKRRNGLIACFGGGCSRFRFDSDMIQGVSFESIVAGLDYVCGVTTKNLSVICWGPGWSNLHLPSVLPLGMVLPGPCVKDGCNSCGMYPDSDMLCHGSGSICYSCQIQVPLAVPVPLLPTSPSFPKQQSNSSVGDKNLGESLTFMVVGSIGAFAGLCTILYLFWICARRFLKTKVDNSVEPADSVSDAYDDMTPMPNLVPNVTILRSFSRLSSRRFKNGSSSKQLDRTESFSLCELAAATDNFSVDNKIGAGSFGSVYRGKLEDGREVAVKRGDTNTKKKKFQEKEIAFDSELVLLSRLHHKHLVKLIGFCEEKDEMLLVYEYMCNGSLHDHLHDKSNIERGSSILNSWKMRIKIALDAARGIEYIHNYAVPPIIHRDIKSSNILLDSNWNARVSDFGLSLIEPETESEQELVSTKAVGTVGYIDPEYYVLNVLTTKSDVYGLGVVMLELLTGKKAVFKAEDGSGPIGLVEYAEPKIAAGEVWSVLDYKIGEPEVNEVESVELMAYTAMDCVNLEGKERPEMTNIVANLERALAFVEYSPGSMSNSSFSASV